MTSTKQRQIQALLYDQKAGWYLVISVCLLATGLRFIGLSDGPPGFYIDEAAIAAQVICVRQSGTDVYGNHLPLMSQVLGGGYVTPVYLYGASLWTSLFGDSIVAFRSFAAFFGALTVVGVFFLAQTIWRRRDIAWLCALCAAVSPWGFLFSRIAWDPALTPCFLVWAFYFILRSGKMPIIEGGLAGISMALAMYSYPPTRVQAILMLPITVVFILKSERLNGRKTVAFGVSTLALLAPLLALTADGTIQGRFNMLSIWNKDYLQQFGGFSIFMVLRLFIENIALHLSPKYLFLSGDGNLRHSTQFVGQWSSLDIFSLLALGYLLVRNVGWEKREKLAVLFLITAYLAGITPAALTWESNPHALRSIGAYPFLALMSGWILYRVHLLHKQMIYFTAVCGLVFFSLYFRDLIAEYPKRSAQWFDISIVQAAATNGDTDVLSSIRSVDSNYADLAVLYYQLRSGQVSCER